MEIKLCSKKADEDDYDEMKPRTTTKKTLLGRHTKRQFNVLCLLGIQQDLVKGLQLPNWAHHPLRARLDIDLGAHTTKQRQF